MQHVFILGSHHQEGKSLLARHLVAELPQHALVRINAADATPDSFASLTEYVVQRFALAREGNASAGGYLVVDCESGASAALVAHLAAVTGYDHERHPWVKSCTAVCMSPNGEDMPQDFMYANGVFDPKAVQRIVNLSSRHENGCLRNNYASPTPLPYLKEEPTWNEVSDRQIVISNLLAECLERECLTGKVLNDSDLWGLGNRTRRVMAMDSEMKSLLALIKTTMARNALSV